MVELRTRTHLNSQLHSIRAIKDGSIKIVVNKDARGKSKLKFRDLVDIYNQENTKDDDESVPRVVRDLDNDIDMTKGSCPEDFSVTLEKIRKQCRGKKRKRRNRGECLTLETEDEGCDLDEPLSNWNTKFSKRRKRKQERITKGGSSSSPSAKQVDLPVYCDVKPETAWDDSYSVTEAMDFIPTDALLDCNKEPESTTSAELVEEIMHDLSEDTRMVLYRSPEPNSFGMVAIEEPISTKPVDEDFEDETFEDASEEFNDAMKERCCLADDIDLDNQADVLCSSVSREEIELEVPQSSEFETIGCVKNLIDSNTSWESEEAKEDEQSNGSNPKLDITIIGLEIVKIEAPEILGNLHMPITTKPDSSGIVAIEEPITTKPVDEAFKDASEEFNDARNAGGCLADNIENQADVLYSSVSREEIELEVPQRSESETCGWVKNLVYSNTSSRSEEAKGDEQSNDPKPKLDMVITGLEIVKIEALEVPANLCMPITGLEIVKIEVPEIVATDSAGLLTMDPGVENTEIVWETENIVKDELHETIDIIQLTNCCSSLANLRLVPDDSTIPLEEYQVPERLQPATSGHVDEPEDHKTTQPLEVTTVAETDSIEQQKLHNQPEKLLSGRKALSPTSQAKLRKAMEHPDSPEKKCKKSKGKLYFSSQNSHRILKAQGLDNIDRVEVIPNSKQPIQKANNNTQLKQYQRATKKFSRRDTRAANRQPFSTGCTSIQGCSQKAITFSQGQVRDFQFVATRLKKELKSMRQIAKRCLLAESNTSNMPDSNLDEVKTLIRNAEKTEKSSEKWLSIIERDSNRFCKLMGMVREDSPPATTENIVEKKKKIKFADDAGGDLCHVKVFEIELESESQI